jgi:hypothetical protein
MAFDSQNDTQKSCNLSQFVFIRVHSWLIHPSSSSVPSVPSVVK